jgi:hypothetical protein
MSSFKGYNIDTTDSNFVARLDGAAGWIDTLLGFEVEVPPELRANTEPTTIYFHECFYRSWRYVADNMRVLLRNAWLVHGVYAKLDGLPAGLPHAWVEIGEDIVFDGVLQRFFPRQGYYEILHAEAHYKYDPGAATLLAHAIPHSDKGAPPYGEWHLRLKLPPPDPKNPLQVTFDMALELLEKNKFGPRAQAKGSGKGGRRRRGRK